MLKYISFILTALLISCTIDYHMIDGSIDADTFSVELFEEQAANAPSGYGADYTQFLKEYIISRTKLKMKNKDADIEVFGNITHYNTSPVSVQSDEAAALNRLTISLAVTVINNVNDEQSFESSFTQFSDFNADEDLSAVEDALLEDINGKLSQEIINRLTSNW